jgi:tetratricopeptide (TPR) repeat protein
VTGIRRSGTALVALALVACLLGGQALADARIPTRSGAAAAGTMGRAGFAYLTGMRRFAALLLWNRLEPQYHAYYVAQKIKDLRFLQPNLQLVVALDPQFVQAYYMVPWLLLDNGRTSEAIAVAREGVANNPDSGLLHTALAQILYLKTKDLTGAVEQADLAMRSNQLWADETEQWQSLKILVDIYRKAGLTQKADLAEYITKVIENHLGTVPGFRDPDAQF